MKKTVSFSRESANVFFHILTACNLSCRHCYIDPVHHGTQLLPLDTVETWLEIFASKAPKTNLVILGGEPTLHPELPAILKKAQALKFQSVTVDTNGYLFHDLLSRIEPDDLDVFSFSLDGATAATNDAIRGKGSFDACTDGIRRAVARGFSTSLIYTVSRDNLHELPMMGSLLKNLGIERFFIQVIGIRGRSAQQGGNLLQLTKKEWTTVVPAAAEAIARLGLPVIFPKVFLEPGEPFECAGKTADNYFIFPNGRVYRCPLCEDYALHSLLIEENRLRDTPPINENDLFQLDIPEGCVMNKLVQPDNLAYGEDGLPEYKVACCLLKESLDPSE